MLLQRCLVARRIARHARRRVVADEITGEGDEFVAPGRDAGYDSLLEGRAQTAVDGHDNLPCLQCEIAHIDGPQD